MIVPAHAISNGTTTHITGNHTTCFLAVVHNSAGGGALPHGSLQFKRPAYKKRHGGRQTAVHGHERSRGGDTALRDAALDGPEEEGGRGREKRARAEQDADAGRATAA